jgi:hypothetical protein
VQDSIEEERCCGGVDSNSSLAGLTVTNDQLTLTMPDGHHGVNGLKASHHRLVDGTTRKDTGGLLRGTTTFSMEPFPSMGSPRALTTRPRRPGPTGNKKKVSIKKKERKTNLPSLWLLLGLLLKLLWRLEVVDGVVVVVVVEESAVTRRGNQPKVTCFVEGGLERLVVDFFSAYHCQLFHNHDIKRHDNNHIDNSHNIDHNITTTTATIPTMVSSPGGGFFSIFLMLYFFFCF